MIIRKTKQKDTTQEPLSKAAAGNRQERTWTEEETEVPRGPQGRSGRQGQRGGLAPARRGLGTKWDMCLSRGKVPFTGQGEMEP